MKIDEITENLEPVSGITRELVKEAESKLGLSLPEEYVSFVLRFNGAEGPIGANSYLATWPVESLVQFNKECEVEKSAPGLLIFGSDAAGMAYAFDTRANAFPIVESPFIGMSVNDALFCAQSFFEFLRFLYDRE